jgi:3-hydroxyacyl-CoA dehydrogenase/enoyl-CoA hydratase/3-hydroxybutyryl-CoA epimerase
LKGSIIVNVGWHFFTRVCGKFINGGGLMRTSDVPLTVLANVAKKVGIAVGPLAILDKINLKCML